MLEIQKYLQNKSLIDLEQELGIKHNRHSKYPNLVLLKYDQIKSPTYHPIVKECRGIILDESDNWKVISYPFNRFYNYGQNEVEKAIDWSTAVVQEKLDGCFRRDQLIDCYDGSLIKIGDIVNKEKRPVLIGVDKKGNLVPSYITAVKNNGTKNNWLKIHFRDKISQKTKKNFNNLVVTSNHYIYNVFKQKYVPASTLKQGDYIYSYIEGLNKDLENFIIGSLLGDGCINRQGSFVIGHKKEKDLFLEWEKSKLGELFARKDFRTSGYGSEMCRLHTYVNGDLKRLREKWYVNDIKCIPKDLVLNDYIVAKWYLDDGHRSTSVYQKDRACFATNSFTFEDCTFLAEQLEKLYKIKTTVFNAKGWTIRINTGKNNEINTFWKRIASYIPLDMEYKLPEQYRNIPKTVHFPKIVKKKVKIQIESIEQLDNTRKNFPSGRSGYDIETTTNNYFANGVLVHNSLIQLYYYAGEWLVATSGKADASGIVNGFDFTFKQLFWRIFNQLNYKLPNYLNLLDKFTFIFELCTIYNKVVVEYKEPKLVLLGARRLSDYAEFSAEELGEFINFEIVNQNKLTNIEDVINYLKGIKGNELEGFVVVDKNFNRIKIKSEEYVALHHIKNKVNTPYALLEVIRKGETEELLVYFKELTQEINELDSKYKLLTRLINNCWNRYKDIDDRKMFALAVKNYSFSDCLFSLYLKRVNSVEDYLLNLDIKRLYQWVQQVI